MKREKRVASIKSPNNIVLLLLGVLLLSCGGYSLHTYQSVGGEWHRGRSLAFVQDSAFSSAADSLALYVGVRYSAAYEYKNLCLQVTTLDAGDSIILCDTVCCDIYDNAGLRRGSTAGALYQAEYYVASLPVSNGAAHTISLQHIMQDSLLQGIYDVGIKLVPLGRHLCAGM